MKLNQDWGLWKIGLLLLWSLSLDAERDQYSRINTYNDEIVLRCSNKHKPTVQILQEYSDVLSYGKESVDLRIARKTFARVQSYFPHCNVIVQDLEATVQEAEAQMFPKRTREQDAWMKTVIQSVLPDSDMEERDQAASLWNKAMEESRTWFQKYHDYASTVQWYQNLANNHKDLVRFVSSIGETVEGRKMPCIHITASKDRKRKKFYIQCQIHAREWISGAVCMYIAERLIKDYKVTKKDTHLLEKLEIVLVPFVNPDGYVYTWTKDRLWRKNRNKKHSTSCVGVDLNRNFPDGFKKTTNKCAADYGGPAPMSEVETRHIMANFRANSPVIGSLDFHSYGQLILRPYGKTGNSSEHESLHRKIGSEMASRIKTVHNKVYVSEKSYDLYPCYGIVADWLYSDDAAKTNGGYRSASFCIELRGTSPTIGFLLPANEIMSTAQEVYPAVLYYMKEMLANPIPYSSPSRTSAFSIFDREVDSERYSRH